MTVVVVLVEIVTVVIIIVVVVFIVIIIIVLVFTAKEDLFSSLFSVCLLPTLRRNFQTDLHEILTEVWLWANEQMLKFRWRSGSPSGYRDCFPDSSPL